MAQTLTPLLSLKKYDQGDHPGAAALNSNWDKIDEKLGPASATLAGAGFLTLAVEASLPASKRLQGTPNQVILTVNAGDLVLSLPQNIHTGATPRFAGLTIGSAATEGLDVSVIGSSVQLLEKGAFPGYTLAIGTQHQKNVEVWYDGGPIWSFGNSVGAGGHFFPVADNSYDAGLASFRIRDVRVGRSFIGPDGSSATPVYRTSGATGLGMYFVSGSNRVLLAGNSVNLLSVDPTVGMALWGIPIAFCDNVGTRLTNLAASAAILEQKDGATAQSFRVYGNTTGSKYINVAHDGTNAILVAEGAGASLIFGTQAAARWIIDPTGPLYPSPDNSYDLAGPSNRIRSGYFGTSISIGTTPASGGLIRLPNSIGEIRWRNAANTQDVGIRLSGANFISSDGGTEYPAGINWHVTTGQELQVTSTGVNLIGHLLWTNHNTYDVGSATNAPRYVYWGTQSFGPNGSASSPAYAFANFTQTGAYAVAPGTFRIAVLGVEQILVGNGDMYVPSILGLGLGADCLLQRDAANIMALKNADLPQQVRVYGAVTGTKYLGLRHDGTNALMNAQAGVMLFQIAGTSKIGMDSAGSWLCQTDNAQDFGDGSFRWRSGFFGTSVTLGSAPASAGYARLPYDASLIKARNGDNNGDIEVLRASTVNSVKNILRFGVDGSAGIHLYRRTAAGLPTTSDIPDGEWCLWRDSSGGSTRLYYNNGGTLQFVELS